MANIFIRTSIAPYRIDIYNQLSEKLGMKMYFYRRRPMDQPFDPEMMESLCHFKPEYLKGIETGRESRKICFGIWRILRKEKPEIVIVPEFQPVLFQVLAFRWLFRKSFKVVSMTDDSYDMVANGNDFTRLHARLRSRLAPKLDDFITVTPEVENWYRTNYSKGIWLPIVREEAGMVEKYRRLLPESGELAAKYGLEGKKVLLYVGRLVKLKNLSTLIEAFASIDGDAVLVLVGDGPERESLENQAKSLGADVIFAGRFDGDELYSWYNVADVCVLPSLQEPFGAVVNEGLLAGARYIVSKRAGASCLIDGTNGELVDPEDARGLSDAIQRQLEACEVRNEYGPRPSLMRISLAGIVDETVRKLEA